MWFFFNKKVNLIKNGLSVGVYVLNRYGDFFKNIYWRNSLNVFFFIFLIISWFFFVRGFLNEV